MSFNNQNYNTQGYSRIIQQTPSFTQIQVDVDLEDTYITNKESENPLRLFEPNALDFINLTDVDNTSNLLYRRRKYTKVGYDLSGKYREVFTTSPQKQIDTTLKTIEGYTTGVPYNIGNATLTLTLKSGIQGSNLFAFLSPLDSNIDQSVSWYKPSEGRDELWDNYGGDLEPLASDIVALGTWTDDKVSFDITPFLNIWNGSGKPSLSIFISGDESSFGSLLEFHSQESSTPFIGGSSLDNCRFLSYGDTNVIKTEGIRISITQSNSISTIRVIDSNTQKQTEWTSINACVSIGNTFAMFSPDIEQGISLGTIICTVVDKTDNGLIVTGISIPNITEYYTTAEFSGTSTIPSGTSIIEISNPNTQTITDISALKNNDNIFVNYKATTINNNVRSFTIQFVADEILKQNRLRIYLNETAVTENRTGLYTELKTTDIRPKLTMNLLY